MGAHGRSGVPAGIGKTSRTSLSHFGFCIHTKNSPNEQMLDLQAGFTYMSKCVSMATVDAVNIYYKLSNKNLSKYLFTYTHSSKFRHYVMNHNVCAGTHTHRTSHANYLEILSKDMFAYAYSLTFRS